jgi:hypothetical protein
MRKVLQVVGVNILVFGGLLLGLEAVGQSVAMAWPSYSVVFLQPDRVLGWKQVPNLQWTWTGLEWYAADFSVNVTTNSLGFRDLPREMTAPAGVKRIAVLGDSFIEAVQVPLEQTATQVLERQLNADAAGSTPHRWEVLNFGISNFGIGQYFLTWQEYAQRFQPDYVAIFVAKLHMQRTIQKYAYGAFPGTEQKRLGVRPTFRLENGNLVLEPAPDYDLFVDSQKQMIEKMFEGRRSQRKRSLVVLRYARVLRDDLSNFKGRVLKLPPRQDTANDEDSPMLLPVSLKLVETLGRQVADSGGRLIVLDASRYFGDDPGTTAALSEVCTSNGFGYVPVYKDLLDAQNSGIQTRWTHDSHLSREGNVILAASLHRWILEDQRSKGVVAWQR